MAEVITCGASHAARHVRRVTDAVDRTGVVSMRIGELAQRSGVSVRSLRYYEEQGLLTSERSPSGQRRYCEQDVERVLFLQRLYGAGLSSRTILELLPCVDSPSLDNSRAALERMAQEREKLSAHIADLIRTREELDSAMARARRGAQDLAAPPGR